MFVYVINVINKNGIGSALTTFDFVVLIKKVCKFISVVQSLNIWLHVRLSIINICPWTPKKVAVLREGQDYIFGEKTH